MVTENRIYIKTKGDAAGDPATSDIKIGEMALNSYSGKLYVGTKLTDDDGTYPGGTPDEASWVGAPINDTDAFSDASATTLATSESIKAYADLKLPKTGGTMSGVIAMGANAITGVADPSGAQDAATKAYVDATAQGLYIHDAVVVATTAELNATYANGTAGVGATLTNAGTQAAIAIDGVTLTANERVLVKDQATGSTQFENGIYQASTLGDGSNNWVLTRVTDFDAAADVKSGAFVFVQEGTANADSGFVQTDDTASRTMGTTAIAFSQFSGAGQITAGTNLSKSGNTLNYDGTAISVTGAAGVTITDSTGDSATEGANLVLVANDGAAMQSGSRLGVVEFKGAEDGADTLTTGARIEATTDAAWTNAENGASLEFYTTDANAAQSKVLTLDSDKLATFAGNVAPAGITLGGHTFDDIDVGTEFTDADDHLMSAGAIKEKIESYNYGTSSGDLTAIIAGTNLGGSNLDGPIPTINLDPSIDLAGGAITLGALAQAGAITQNPTTVGTAGNALTVTGSLVTTGSGTANRAGGDIVLAGGAGTGTATSGSILFKTTPAGGSSGTGTSDGTQATMLTISSTGLSTPGTLNVDGATTLDDTTIVGDAFTGADDTYSKGVIVLTPAGFTENNTASCVHPLAAGVTIDPLAVTNSTNGTTTTVATLHVDGLPTHTGSSYTNLYSIWCGGVDGTTVDGRIGGAIISGGTY